MIKDGLDAKALSALRIAAKDADKDSTYYSRAYSRDVLKLIAEIDRIYGEIGKAEERQVELTRKLQEMETSFDDLTSDMKALHAVYDHSKSDAEKYRKLLESGAIKDGTNRGRYSADGDTLEHAIDTVTTLVLSPAQAEEARRMSRPKMRPPPKGLGRV